MKKNQSPAPSAGKVSLRLDWATHAAAKYACENWHYSKCMAANKTAKVGVWEDGIFVGCIVFGVGASAQVFKQFNVGQMQCCELVRVALSNHKSEVSRMVSIAMRMIKKSFPNLKVIVSFADPTEKHHGGIYQAGNWIYTGMSAATTEYFYRDKWHHTSAAYHTFGAAGAKKIVKRRIRPGKHRYVMALEDKVKRLVELDRKDYPKRAVSKDNVASPYQGEEGGVTPTTALQKIIT